MRHSRWHAEFLFENVVVSIESGGLIDTVDHPNPDKYPRQKVMVVEIENYAYLVPYVDEDDYYFLKTVIPSRKATRELVNKGEPDVQT